MKMILYLILLFVKFFLLNLKYKLKIIKKKKFQSSIFKFRTRYFKDFADITQVKATVCSQLNSEGNN